jgi:hypothetical protein
VAAVPIAIAAINAVVTILFFMACSLFVVVIGSYLCPDTKQWMCLK